MVDKLLAQVGHVDRGWHNGLDPGIDRCSQPGGPAALGTAQHQEIADDFPLAGGEALHRVHGAHRRLGHCQMHRPFRVARVQRLVQAIGKNRVFLARPAGFIGKVQRLIGYLPHHRQHRTGGDRSCAHCRIHFIKQRAVIVAAIDQQHRRIAAVQPKLRHDDQDFVFPDRPVDLSGAAPLLGGHLEKVGVVAEFALAAVFAETVMRIRPGNVAIKRSFRRLRQIQHPETADEQEKTERAHAHAGQNSTSGSVETAPADSARHTGRGQVGAATRRRSILRLLRAARDGWH